MKGTQLEDRRKSCRRVAASPSVCTSAEAENLLLRTVKLVLGKNALCTLINMQY